MSKRLTRRLVPVSFTLKPNQIQYIADQVGPPRERSRWIREAIDLRIAYEKQKSLGLVSDFVRMLHENGFKATTPEET